MDNPAPPVTVQDKTAVVIGGTSGIGEAIALGFAHDGADVIATSPTPTKVDRITERLRDLGATTTPIPCDATNPDDIANLHDTATDLYGPIDILVNAQGITVRKGLLDLPEPDWTRVREVVLDSVYRTTRTFATTMTTGSIINISSISGQLARSDLVAYCAAKAGVEGLTRAAANDLAPAIRVNAIAPGFVITPMTADAYADGTPKREMIETRSPMGRLAEPEEMVGAALYLASDAASFTTGEILRVDGGYADTEI